MCFFSFIRVVLNLGLDLADFLLSLLRLLDHFPNISLQQILSSKQLFELIFYILSQFHQLLEFRVNSLLALSDQLKVIINFLKQYGGGWLNILNQGLNLFLLIKQY